MSAFYSVYILGAETGSTGVRRVIALKRKKKSRFRHMGTESKAIRAVYKRNPAQECTVQMQEENSRKKRHCPGSALKK